MISLQRGVYMTKLKQKRYDKIREELKHNGIEIWGYQIIPIQYPFFNNNRRKSENTIKNTPIKLKKSDNGVEYLIVGKNE